MREQVGLGRRKQVLVSELLLLTALITFCFFMARSTYLRADPQLIGTAIMIDLTFTASLCHWLLGIRLGGLPRWTLVPTFALGLAVGRALLPASIANTGAFSLVAIAVLECSALLVATVNLRKIARSVAAARRAGDNTFDALEAALLALAPSVPGLASYARFELQIWTMCCAGWFMTPRPAPGPGVFTHHKEPHWFALVGVLAFMVTVEGILAHVLLEAYHFTTTKWIFAASSGYALVWLFGDLQALRVYRSAIRGHTLELRIGARGHATIALRNIASVELGAWAEADADEALFVLFGKANVKLSFHEPNTYKPAFSGAKRVRALLVQIDEPERFRTALLTG